MAERVERREYWKIALVTVPAIVIVGWLMGVVSDSGSGNGWYDGLAKPSFQPVGSSRVDLQACKLEYSIVSPK